MARLDGSALRVCGTSMCIGVGAFLLFGQGLWGQISVLTWHNDAARTGQNLAETILTPANVSSATFGKLFTIPVDGLVDAQPLYVPSVAIPSMGTHNVLYVATEHDSLYAFDADTGAQLWRVSLLLAGEQTSDDRGCGQVTPEIGITSTPAIDLASGTHGTIYAVAMSLDSSNNYHQRLHALDLTTGTEEFSGPKEVQATFPSTGPQSSGGIVTFDPKQYKDRAALLISKGIVYTSWASHCDAGPYTAWIMGYNEATLAQVSVIDLTPNGSDGSIWQAGAGPAADAGGSLFFLVANGTFDTTLTAGGLPVHGDYGNAFMNLSTASGLSVADYFTMDNTVSESNGDVDLGSGGAMLLPTLNDSSGNPRILAVGAGKDASAYVVDRSNMGKFHASSNAVFQQLALGGGVWSSPAWFNNTLYYGPVGSPLQAFTFTGGKFGSTPSSQSPASFGYPGATPSISANGTSNGIVWAAENVSPAVLHAYRADSVATELYNSNQAANSRDHFGNGNKYITPMIANGKVYVGTSTGVGVFGLLGCTYSIGSGSESFTSSASGGSVTVTAGSGCAWTTVNDSNFVVITGGASGSGNGTVTFTIPANAGTARAGSLVIAGHALTISQSGETATTGLAFYPLKPCRIADTRAGSGFAGAFGPPSLSGGTSRSFPVPSSACGVPASAQAYSLNVTVVPNDVLGYLTAWPAGSSMPLASTLNSSGSVVGNAAIVPAGASSAISLYAANNTDVIVDINGYFAAPGGTGALAFYPMTPCRVADTRATENFSGAFGPPSLAADATRSFPFGSSGCSVPASALAYSMRLTTITSGPLGYLTAWPAGQTMPEVSSLNNRNPGVVGNEAIVPAGSGGEISVYTPNNADLVIDINGYFAPPGSPGALYLYTIPPCRVADTRSGSGFNATFGPPSLAGGATRDFPIVSSGCAIPSTAQAYALNVTVVASGPAGYVTAWPSGQSLPLAATVNAPYGGVVANAATVRAGTNGDIDVFAAKNVDIVIDIDGYFAP